MKRSIALSLLLALAYILTAQPTYPQNGVSDHREGLYAFTNATIYKAYNQKLDNATLLIRDGKVENIGRGISIPKGAVVIDLEGKTIYPAFVESYSAYGMPTPKPIGERPRLQPQMLSNKDGAYAWNEALRSEIQAATVFGVDTKAADEMRRLGFATALTHHPDGISRGSGAIVHLSDEPANLAMLAPQRTHHLSFSKGVSTQNYPSSLMGAIALLRQTYLDGKWYDRNGSSRELNLSLARWNELQDLPQVFEVTSWQDAMRAARIGKEHSQTYIIRNSGGDEYQRLDALKGKAKAWIVGLDFPKAYEVDDPFDAQQVDLAQMKHWELAPENPARMVAAGMPILLTTHGLESKAAFLTHLRIAVKRGLSERDALQALTDTPARMLGVADKVGSLERGRIASFIVTSGNIFEEGTDIHETWVRGNRYTYKPLDGEPQFDRGGIYNLQVGDQSYRLNISGTRDMPRFYLDSQGDTTDVSYKMSNRIVTFNYNAPNGEGRKVRLTGTLTDTGWSGTGETEDGNWVNWRITPTRGSIPLKAAEAEAEATTISDDTTGTVGEVLYPFMGFGNAEVPTAETYLFRNATVWTNEDAGILTETDVLVRNGRIAQVGKNLSASGATVIDATGKHLTSGIIDEHSHIAISKGVNEGTQYSSAEVRIGDVVNSEDINIYRQLAGGVTASQLLHGSANPIGGQSALIKMRWGKTYDEMQIEGADGFIKFALGENVKQSNWGDDYRLRFPQTRMGVEQVYVDHFTRAREYERLSRSGQPYRRDLEMEAILEILNKRRFISCHSYVQSEINMLMKVGEQFGFTINTFTHILEGYKVADKMAEHGAGGSTFSDWWAYKYEVIDAIPQNAGIMHHMGVVTALNSDDAEMGRRLNQEAGKVILYTDSLVTEEEAWKMVTLNPAKLLHLDDRMGSIRVGKDADLVLWTDHPMSMYAKAQVTLVDGVKYFDRMEDEAHRTRLRAERSRLVQKMLRETADGGARQSPSPRQPRMYHCDDMEP